MSRSNSVKGREQVPLVYQQSTTYISPNQMENQSSPNIFSPKAFVGSKQSPKSPYLNSTNSNYPNQKSSTLGSDLNSSYQKMYLGSSAKYQPSQPSSVSQSVSPGGVATRIASSQALLTRNQRGSSVSKAVSQAANSNRSSADNLKNKENFNNSLSKIFFNSPRFKPNTSGMDQNQQLDTPNQSHQYISVLKPSNHESDKKGQNSNENSLTGGSYLKGMKNSATVFTNVLGNTMSQTNTNNNLKIAASQSSKKFVSNQYSNIKQSLVLTKNINLKESNNTNANNNLNQSQTSSRSNRGNQSDSKMNTSSIQNSVIGTNYPSSSSKNTINLTLSRPASTSQAERQSKISSTAPKNGSYAQQQKEDRSKISSVQSSRKSLENSASKTSTGYLNGLQNNLIGNNTNTNESSSQRPSTKSRMSTDSQSVSNVSSNMGKINLQVKSTTNFTASKKLLSQQTAYQLPQSTTSTAQSQVFTTKVNNFMKQFSNQPTSKFSATTKNLYEKKSTKQQSNICDDSSIQENNNQCKDELKEYKKLQEKLSYLETKIMNIKTNIDCNYQKEKEISQHQKSQNQQFQLQLQQQQQPQNNENINQLPQSISAQKISYSANQISSQLSSTLNTGRLTQQEQQSVATTQNLQEYEIERGSSTYSKASQQQLIQQQQQQQNLINIYQQPISDNRISEKSTLTPVTITERESETEIKQPQQNELQKEESNLVKQPSSPTQKSTTNGNGLSSFITQVNQSQNIPFLSKQKGESNSTKSSTSQLQTIKHSSTQNSLKKQSSSTINSSMNKSTQNSSLKTPKQSQQQGTPSNSQNQSQSYKSFAFKSGQNTYTQQHQNQKNATFSSATTTIATQLNQLQNISQNHTLQTAQNNENEVNESQLQRQSVQSMKNSSVLNQLNGINIPQPQSPYIQPKQQQKLYYASSIIKGFQNLHDHNPLMILARDHLIQTMQSIQFSKYIQIPTLKQIESKRVFFNPLKENKKTLIFDLDETLIHCNESVNIPSDVIVPIVFPTGEVIEAGINVRPYAKQILQELSKIYEIVIFTASHSCYANVVLDFLDPKNEFISYRLFRDHCVQTEDGVYVKDLRVIVNRNMQDMIIVDNAAYSFGFQIDNGLPIIPFYDNKDDLELKYLITYMKSIQYVRDFREVNRKLLKISQYSDFVDPIELLESLYPDLLNI